MKIGLCAVLTFSVPGGHGDDPVDSGLSHGADHSIHGHRVARHRREDGGREAEARHDHILSFEMSLQSVCGENISLHHLRAANRENMNNVRLLVPFTFVNTDEEQRLIRNPVALLCIVTCV